MNRALLDPVRGKVLAETASDEYINRRNGRQIVYAIGVAFRQKPIDDRTAPWGRVPWIRETIVAVVRAATYAGAMLVLGREHGEMIREAAQRWSFNDDGQRAFFLCPIEDVLAWTGQWTDRRAATAGTLAVPIGPHAIFHVHVIGHLNPGIGAPKCDRGSRCRFTRCPNCGDPDFCTLHQTCGTCYYRVTA